MPSKVILTVARGADTGREFIFDERTTCLIGRDDECQVRVPDDKRHLTISRHHCLLDINPPDVRIRDFGSLNGTYVNGCNIGQRDKDQTPQQVDRTRFPEFDLKNGDEIRLEDTLYRVGICLSRTCALCGCEIPEEFRDAARRGEDEYLCSRCCTQPERVLAGEKCTRPPRRCTRCGRDVSAEAGAERRGEFLCQACQVDPQALLNEILRRALGDDPRLAAIKGYKILAEIGRGGMGGVYVAHHEETGRQVALKVMLPKVAVEERARQMFLREMENTKVLRHPHVVELFDAGFSAGTFYFSMGLCPLGSMARLTEQRGGTLPIDEAVGLMRQVLDGLEYCHGAEIPKVKLADGTYGKGRGLVHRDLKPANIFLAGPERCPVAKVGDFGLSKAFDTAGLSGLTVTGTAGGTPSYMPRQQVVKFKLARPEVDVWAAAASLYHTLTGCLPRDFPPGKDPWSVVLRSNAVPIRRRNTAIPQRLADVIDEALVDKPEIRIKSASQLKRMLDKAL